MNIRSVLIYPDIRLRSKAEPVTVVDDNIRRLIDDMFVTMYELHGGGLAATQINVQQRIVIVDPYSNKKDTYVLINPEIIEFSGEQKFEEGCLSLPGVSAVVTRSKHIKIKALDYYGEEFTVQANGGYLSACLQHEIDHLNGIVYVDHISVLKRAFLLKKMQKLNKLM